MRALWPWRLVALIMCAVVIGGFALAWFMGPVPPRWYPQCPLRETTGLLCPGCGSARVLHDLAHGNWRAALGHNVLIVALIPILIVWGVWAIGRGLRYNIAPPQAPLGSARIAAIVFIAFMVLRNLPWWPFTLLAP